MRCWECALLEILGTLLKESRDAVGARGACTGVELRGGTATLVYEGMYDVVGQDSEIQE